MNKTIKHQTINFIFEDMRLSTLSISKKVETGKYFLSKMGFPQQVQLVLILLYAKY